MVRGARYFHFLARSFRVASAKLINYYEVSFFLMTHEEFNLRCIMLTSSKHNMTDPTFAVGLGLTILGVVIAVVAVILITASGGNGRSRGGWILLIGPIPIIFGTDQQSVRLLVILAIVLILIVSGLTYLAYLVR